MPSHDSLPILVVGTGPAGLLAAIALARGGQRVTLVGPGIALDRRTTALMTPALQFLNSLDLLSEIAPAAAPLRTMRIVDGTSRLIRSPLVTFRASEIGQEHFGLNIPNSALLTVLEKAVSASPDIDWRKATISEWRCEPDTVHARLDNDQEIAAALAVAADGRLSPARSAASISVSTKTYPQAALVLNFGHSRGHGFVSTEFHTETGPFTQVPLPGQRSSLVWVVAPETAKELASLDDSALSIRIEERMQSILGRVSVEPGRQVYPLSATLPARFAQNRVALVGEAAHVFPPIGAQGLNLGIRDVQDIVRVIAENPQDPGSPPALTRYDGMRRPDILARSAGVNLLNRSLLSDLLPAQLARGLGLTLLGSLSPLRAFFMREGLRPGTGFQGAVSDLRKQIRR
ncbi:UbiH/UbiF family hydroxylase [Arvimicrobium flavum]|uniref:UbiH/UbiF family hydroxylase n=1 Tax=Arvimicrobium flavum TaxID=3393320 RepID=UPI00237BF15D|nr:UbiH/UbiF family hydroxylase [Mesorhizobium shangrilense]